MNRDQIDKHTETVKAGIAFAFMHEPVHSKALSSLAALRALALNTVAVSQWRPVETAPKDGSHVFLWFPPNREDAGAVCGGYFDAIFDQVWMLTHGRGAIDQRVRRPTHWMPLPEGPEPR